MVPQLGSLEHWGPTEAPLWWLSCGTLWPPLRLQAELLAPLDKRIPLFKKEFENHQTQSFQEPIHLHLRLCGLNIL